MPREGEAALPQDRERLRHMLGAARDVKFFPEGRTRSDLDRDRMFMRAVLHAIQEIGAWGSIVQMRHILVHAYFNVNLDYVWRVIERDLEPLIDTMEAALKDWPQ